MPLALASIPLRQAVSTEPLTCFFRFPLVGALVRRAVSSRAYTPYTICAIVTKAKNFRSQPSESPELLSLVNYKPCTTALVSGSRRLSIPDAGVCCHQCATYTAVLSACSTSARVWPCRPQVQRYRHPHHVRRPADILQPLHAHWPSSYEEAQRRRCRKALLHLASGLLCGVEAATARRSMRESWSGM